MSIAVDLDGTLAHYDGYKGPNHIGTPVPDMLNRVKAWLLHGEEVVIFTARGGDAKAVRVIEEWLDKNGIGGLRVTNQKDFEMTEFWDDRAIRVEKNTGKVMSKLY